MNLDDLLKPNGEEGRKPDGVLWEATAYCQICNEFVPEQTLYPAESLLVWTCSKDHRSFLEGYKGF